MTEIYKVGQEEIEELSQIASAVVREHYDPILGTEQNDYMIEKFQSVSAIKGQIKEGYRYFWVKSDDEHAGFFAIYPRDGKMYISKFYLRREFRGRGLAGSMLDYIRERAREEGLSHVFLNVNRFNANTIQVYKHLGFSQIREEKIDIGHGYYMDDYVLECDV